MWKVILAMELKPTWNVSILIQENDIFINCCFSFGDIIPTCHIDSLLEFFYYNILVMTYKSFMESYCIHGLWCPMFLYY